MVFFYQQFAVAVATAIAMRIIHEYFTQSGDLFE